MTLVELRVRARALAHNLERYARGELARDLERALAGECVIVGRQLQAAVKEEESAA